MSWSTSSISGRPCSSRFPTSTPMPMSRPPKRWLPPWLGGDNLSTVLTAQYDDTAFASGLLMRIELATGELSWTNAGHPCPLLIRGGRVIGELEVEPTPPWGLIEGTPTQGSETLEPGDSLLLYTDGVVDARTSDGDRFGLDRLTDLTGQIASDQLPAEEVVRRLVRAVLEHQKSNLSDDATLVVVQWQGPTDPH